MQLSAAEIINHWDAKSNSLEQLSMGGWESAAKSSGIKLDGGRLFRSVHERFSDLYKQGLTPDEIYLGTLADLMSDFDGALKRFSRQDLFVFIQPSGAGIDVPNIKGHHLTPESLRELGSYLIQHFPHISYEVTIVPYYQITHMANVMINSDRSVTIEATLCGTTPSRGGELLFRAESRPFFSWPVFCSTNDPEHRELAQKILESIPKRSCEDGLGEEYQRGYYEIAIGRDPRSKRQRVLFYDARYERHFTL